MNSWIAFSVMALVLAAATGCSKEEGFTQAGEKQVTVTSEVKIKIGVNGEISANGKTLGQEEFLQELQRIKQSNGGIVYTRENPTGESTPAQSAVIQVLQASGIPLKYSRE